MNPLGGKAARAHHPDYVIALVIAILLAVGLVMMYSISPILSHKLGVGVERNFYFLNQIKYVLIGLVVWIVASSISYNRWRKWSPWLMGVAIISLIGLLIPSISHSSHGATRWLDLGPISVQPAEILKISLILYLAAWLEKRQEEVKSFWDGLFPFGVMAGAAAFVVVVLQKDMGTAMVIALSTVGMYFAAGMLWRHLGLVAALGAAASWVFIMMAPHRVSRLTTFLDPSHDATGQGYHINQALIAIGSGGVLGLGLGKSIQVYGYLPEAANDSIFAIIAEEFGLLGSIGIIVAFGVLAYRGLLVARSAPDTFSRLAATGISLWLLFQSVINIGAMLALVPLTGIPLPFISYGGTSLIISLLGAGILLNISKYTVREVTDAGSRQRRGDSRPYFANPGNQRRVKTAR
ncbi:MAG: FtsW, cell division rane protein cell division protein FtsW [Candidatus Saccharibacteria bacterium]|nr:FtsW, cell division rane protein cell division protein FtsW [Candidatus Saccharibacteria bacterium]